jgi:hypothetical protein
MTQCQYQLLSNSCQTPNGYDVNTCSNYFGRCYSNTAPQCKNNSDCSYSFSNLQCVNKNSNQSNYNCYLYPSSFTNPCSCHSSGSKYYQISKSQNFSQKASLADGGFTDPCGLLPLLARKVQKIILFENFLKVNDLSDPVKNCFYMNTYFGVYDVNDIYPI